VGFFDKIKSAVGVGQPSLEIHLDRPSVSLGGVVSGTARATGQERALQVAGFDVRIKRLSQQQGMTVVAEERIPFGGATLAPGQTLETSFALQVPANGPASGGGIEYELTVGLDVPGLDPMKNVKLYVDGQLDAYAGEELARFHVLPAARAFRHSSVRGDFRLVRTADGFLAYWKDHTTLRNADGSERARIELFGRTATPAPDGRIAAADGYKRIGFFDGRTGEQVGELVEVGEYVNDIVFLADGSGMVLNGTSKLLVSDASGRVQREITDLGIGELYVSSICAGEGSTVYVTDANQSKLVALDVHRGVLGAADTRYPSDVQRSADGTLLVVDSSNGISIFDTRAQRRAQYPIPGKEGVRYLGQEPHSHTHFKGNARLSPDNRFVLVQDGSGQLYLLDAVSGAPQRRYDRSALDYVEDTLWWDASHFVAILNDGRVVGMRLDGTPIYQHAQ
jgi:WD40 repeat protein